MTTGRTCITLIPVKGLNITANYGMDNVDYRMKRYENPLVGDGTAGPGRLSQSSLSSYTDTYRKEGYLAQLDYNFPENIICRL